ncbi:hypothetical protein Trydic_g6516 [Trypoxylus dichotomus]
MGSPPSPVIANGAVQELSYRRFGEGTWLMRLDTVVRTIVEQARRVCSEEQLQKELDHLRRALRYNAYPENIISSTITSKPRPRDKNDRDTETLGTAYLSYINNSTNRIGRVLMRFNIGTVFTPTHPSC